MTGSRTRQLFTDQEFTRRWQAFRRIMADLRVDLALLVDPGTIAYLTGFAGPSSTFQALIVPADQDPLHVLRYVDERAFLEVAWLDHPVFYNDWDDPVALTARLAANVVPWVRRIGIEKASAHLSAHRHEQLLSQWPHALGVDLSAAIGSLRLIKSDEEIDRHRRAASAVQQGLEAGIAAIRAGIAEREIAAAVAAALACSEADTLLPGTIASGRRPCDLDPSLGDRTVRPGDLLRFEIVNSVDGYWARIARTVSLGRPNAETIDLYNRLQQAQHQQATRLLPGAVPSDLDQVVRARVPVGIWAIQHSGYAFGAHSCHPWGDELCRLWIVRGEHRALAAGMVFCLSLAAEPGLSIADTVVVSGQGGQYLTTYPRELLMVE